MFEVEVKRGTIKAQAASETLTFIRIERHGEIIVYGDLDSKENWDAYMNRLRELTYHIERKTQPRKSHYQEWVEIARTTAYYNTVAHGRYE